MKNLIKISACLVVYNEEKLIGRCLDNIRDIVDEIIVVHDGKCSDKTLQIAKKYGAKTFIRKHIGEAEPHRNFSFAQAMNEWILQIDADEYLSSALKKQIQYLVQDVSISGYAFKWDTYCAKNKHIYDYKLCLFQKNKIASFRGIPHEAVKLNGMIKKLNLELVHKPKTQYQTWSSFKRKLKWAHIQAGFLVNRHIAKHFCFFYLFKAILWFFLYFGYTLLKYKDLKISLFSAIYSFLVWWDVFLIKLKKTLYFR